MLLEIPLALKEKGVNGIIYGGTFMSVDYKGRSFSFTVYKDDITKTYKTFDDEFDGEVDPITREEIWLCISCNWLQHVYTEEEINKSALGSEGSKAEFVLQIAKKYCNQLFVDEYKVPHAAITVNEHLEVLPLTSRRFKNWLRRALYKETDLVVATQVIENVIDLLVADAEFDGESKQLGLRTAIAADDEFKWYYDLVNGSWEFIEITSEGWKVHKNAIIFRRFSHQRPQVYPEPKYPSDIFDQFMNLLNIKKEYRLTLKCYIISLFIPNLPKAVLMVHGEQGTAKSMLQELIKMLVDPSIIRTLSFPKSTAELVQQLSHHPVTYYDNLSRIPEWISDLLCRAVTGSGFSKRELYTNDEDVIYSLTRAIGFNGINLAATKPDLLDRGLIIQTETIPKGNRRKMKAIWEKFDNMRPYLLAYILDVLVKVLKWKKDNPRKELIKELPRMADWAETCEIISRCMGEEDNKFIEAYQENIKLQTEEVVEASDIAIALREFVNTKPMWSGTPTALLLELNRTADIKNIDRYNKFWPKTPSRLGRILKTLQRTLREIGIVLEWTKDTSTKQSTRIIKIQNVPSEPSERQIGDSSALSEVYGSDATSDDTINKEITVVSEAVVQLAPQSQVSDVMTSSDSTDDNFETISDPLKYPPPKRPRAFQPDVGNCET